MYLFSICIGLQACSPKELPVPKHAQGDVEEVVIPLTPKYNFQIFYSLQNQQIARQQLRTDWDLAFSCNSMHIKLNSAKLMALFSTNKQNFEEVMDTMGFEINKRYDSPSGNLDSTAFGEWWLNQNIFIIDRGFNENGQHLGFKKLQILKYQDSVFYGAIADLNQTQPTNFFQIRQNTQFNFVGISLDSFQAMEIEPPKDTWDIVFTTYTENLGQPYLVVGVLLNPFQTLATMEQSIPFHEITYDYAINLPLSYNQNTIGYAWKQYNFNTSSYQVFPNYIYILKNHQGYYFKLRFIDFYNERGEKGYPTFEFQRL